MPHAPAHSSVTCPVLEEVTFWHLFSEYALVPRGAVPSVCEQPSFARVPPAQAASVVGRALGRSWPNADWHLMYFLGLTQPERMGLPQLDRFVSGQLASSSSPYELFLRMRP